MTDPPWIPKAIIIKPSFYVVMNFTLVFIVVPQNQTNS